MDGLILIWSVTLSNHIAKRRWPEGIEASYRRALRDVAQIMLSHLRPNEGYKKPVKIEGYRWDHPQIQLWENTEDHHKILIRFPSALQRFLPSYLVVSRQRISGWRLTKSEYTLQLVIILFGKLLSHLAEAGFTCTDHNLCRICEIENINHLVLRYLNTGASPFQEWAEECLRKGKVYSSYTKERVCREGLIYRVLA